MPEPDPLPDPEPVATGDRRDEVRLEPDKDQLVKMRATFKPDAPMPPEMQSEAWARAPHDTVPPVEDVAVAPESPSVWDARPESD
jgi:hypothetical protein